MTFDRSRHQRGIFLYTELLLADFDVPGHRSLRQQNGGSNLSGRLAARDAGDDIALNLRER